MPKLLHQHCTEFFPGPLVYRGSTKIPRPPAQNRETDLLGLLPDPHERIVLRGGNKYINELDIDPFPCLAVKRAALWCLHSLSLSS